MFAVWYFFLVAVELLLGRSNENMPGSSRAPSLRLTDMEAVRDTIGHVITRDVDPPTFATLGVPCLKFETNARRFGLCMPLPDVHPLAPWVCTDSQLNQLRYGESARICWQWHCNSTSLELPIALTLRCVDHHGRVEAELLRMCQEMLGHGHRNLPHQNWEALSWL